MARSTETPTPFCKFSPECRPQPNKLCVALRNLGGKIPPGEISLGEWDGIVRETKEEEKNCAAPDIVDNQLNVTRRQISGSGRFKGT